MKRNKETLNNILYHICFGMWWCFSKLPFCFHYAMSDIFSAILFHLVRYRRELVHKNMMDSFPDKTEKDLRKHIEFRGMDLLAESSSRGKSCGIFVGHYGNWEWQSSIPMCFEPGTFLVTQLYHPLENPVFDRLIAYTRERFGGKNIPVNESVRHFVKYKKEGTPIIIGFLADQVPFWNNIHYFTSFLNHPDTPVFTGPERLMKKFDMDVYYLDMWRPKRGHYIAEYKRITTTPNDYKEFELTELYTRMLEETIYRAPQYWLWSHNRWKRTKAEWEKIIDLENHKMRT